MKSIAATSYADVIRPVESVAIGDCRIFDDNQKCEKTLSMVDTLINSFEAICILSYCRCRTVEKSVRTKVSLLQFMFGAVFEATERLTLFVSIRVMRPRELLTSRPRQWTKRKSESRREIKRGIEGSVARTRSARTDRTQYCNNFNYGDTTDCHGIYSTVLRSQPSHLPARFIHLYIRVTQTSWSNWLSDAKGAAFKQVLLNKPLTRETTLENSPLSAASPPFLDVYTASRGSEAVEGLLAFVTLLNSERRSAPPAR